MTPKAKGKSKKRKEARLTELQDEALAKVEVRKSELQIRRTDITTGELAHTIADTVERVTEEFGVPYNRPSAEDLALNLVRLIRYGSGAPKNFTPPRIRDEEMQPPLCRKCR